MITKQQVEGLIERLADKTLSFGCFIKPVQSNTRQIIQVCGQGVFHVESKSFKQSYSNNGEFEVLGHPITIGTVLEKMSARLKYIVCTATYTGCRENPHGREEYFVSEIYAKILHLWAVCGISKSLQEIVEDSGWKPIFTEKTKKFPAKIFNSQAGEFELDAFHGATEIGEPDQVLGSPEASALFEFLLHLFPINNENSTK
jgi:hypothetical protein